MLKLFWATAITTVLVSMMACQPQETTPVTVSSSSASQSTTLSARPRLGAGSAPVMRQKTAAARTTESTPSATAPAWLTLPVETVLASEDSMELDDEGFAINAFPPTFPDTDWHEKAWARMDCMRCHETGVGDAPEVKHAGMADILLQAKCRTCHVIEPGKLVAVTPPAEDTFFAANAFPPMMPDSKYHTGAWGKNDCMMCHDSGVLDAPKIRHAGMPALLRQSKCRTCHVQVRSHTQSPWQR